MATIAIMGHSMGLAAEAIVRAEAWLECRRGHDPDIIAVYSQADKKVYIFANKDISSLNFSNMLAHENAHGIVDSANGSLDSFLKAFRNALTTSENRDNVFVRLNESVGDEYDAEKIDEGVFAYTLDWMTMNPSLYPEVKAALSENGREILKQIVAQLNGKEIQTSTSIRKERKTDLPDAGTGLGVSSGNGNGGKKETEVFLSADQDKTGFAGIGDLGRDGSENHGRVHGAEGGPGLEGTSHEGTGVGGRNAQPTGQGAGGGEELIEGLTDISR